MRTAKKSGFTPEAPQSPPPLTVVEYKPCDDLLVWPTATAGPIELICFRRAAERGRSRALVRFFERKLNALGFSEDAVMRLAIALGEAIPNAMIYGLPGSSVGIVLVITGIAPQRQLMLMVSNFITGAARLPTPDEVPDLEKILYESHGRGTGMLKVLSNGIAIARSDNYDQLTVVHFTEQLP